MPKTAPPSRVSRRPRRSRATGPAAKGASFGGISADAVKRATGKDWAQWVRALDAAGAAGLDHKGIVAIVADRFDIGPWWQQMVTVGYEQAKGLRKKHQAASGYQACASRTIGVPVDRLFRAFADERQRARWLPGASLEVRTARPGKSMRLTWEPGERATLVSITFSAKAPARAAVSIDHQKLPSAAAVRRVKRFWAARLEALKDLLES
jgi:uncharacterized protein YndB with AHSA1/START domain